MGKSSYDRQQKKGSATLTLLNLIFVYSIGNSLVKVVSVASMISTFYFTVSNNYLMHIHCHHCVYGLHAPLIPDGGRT